MYLKQTVLFWISEELILFFVSKHFSDKYGGNICAVIDAPHIGARKLFEQQKFIIFDKVWYYQDNFVNNTIAMPDIRYLRSFEQKYNINLWEIAFSERFFHSDYNPYHKFSRDEILWIMEQECKFFEKILDEAKPSCVIFNIITRHHVYLLYKLCKAKGIKTLVLENVKFGTRRVISEDIGNIHGFDDFQNTEGFNRTFEELQKYLKSFEPDKGLKHRPTLKVPRIEKLKAVMDFLFAKRSLYDKNLYLNYGRSKMKVIILGSNLILSLKRRYRESFINRKFKKTIDYDTPYIYFPLHAEPERDLLISAPFYTNQKEIISTIVKSIPVDYKLYVKDHPSMVIVGWRDIKYYKEIMTLPNVELIHPSINSEELIRNCSMVISVAGTAALEAAFYNKPSIVFADMDFSVLPFIHRIKNVEDLPAMIRTYLQKKVDNKILDKYVNLVNQKSFEFNLSSYISEFSNLFYYVGFLKEVSIPESKLNYFLEKYYDVFERLAEEYRKKME